MTISETVSDEPEEGVCVYSCPDRERDNSDGGEDLLQPKSRKEKTRQRNLVRAGG